MGNERVLLVIGILAVCQKAPISTFDGTLIDDMSFGTLTAQVLSVSNLPVPSADSPRSMLVGIGVIQAGHSDLLEIVGALGSASGFSR